jgi:hypothetical protein
VKKLLYIVGILSAVGLAYFLLRPKKYYTGLIPGEPWVDPGAPVMDENSPDFVGPPSPKNYTTSWPSYVPKLNAATEYYPKPAESCQSGYDETLLVAGLSTQDENGNWVTPRRRVCRKQQA